jgi:transcriptional regulator PpsR
MARKSTQQDSPWSRSQADDVAAIVRAASDVSLVVDSRDVVVEVEHSLDVPVPDQIRDWRGRSIEDLVEERSRGTVRRMLQLSRSAKPTPRFDVSHIVGGQIGLPVRYAAIRLGGDGTVALLGRDRREETDLRARLLSNRQSLERSAKLQRQSDAHYRLLFETASSPLLVADADTGRIRDANPRAAALLGMTPAQLAGKKVSVIAARGDQAEVLAMFAGVAAAGAPLSAQAHAADGTPMRLEANLFRAGELKLVMISIEATDAAGATSDDESEGLDALIRQAPEAIVVTDEAGQAIWANEAFLSLAGIPMAAHLVGRPLDAMFQWRGTEQEIALRDARRLGSVPAFAATLNGAHGNLVEVEMSVVALRGSTAGFGFVLRPASAAVSPRDRPAGDLAQTAEGLVELVGRVPLKDLVRDTTDVIERMCIEAALRLTGNNRAAAARALGLSRQAFYLKLDRFGIGGGD